MIKGGKMAGRRKDPRIILLVDILDQAFDKGAWHGPNLKGSVRGLSVKQLLWRPGPKRHNIWELILHSAYWKYAVRRRMVGGPKGLFPRKPSNYPHIPKHPDARAWKQDLAMLVDYHKQLRQAVLDFPISRLNSNPEGSSMTFLQTIYGVSSHDLYHAGQIQLLKRLQR
jgi:hypothetical protein